MQCSFKLIFQTIKAVARASPLQLIMASVLCSESRIWRRGIVSGWHLGWQRAHYVVTLLSQRDERACHAMHLYFISTLWLAQRARESHPKVG